MSWLPGRNPMSWKLGWSICFWIRALCIAGNLMGRLKGTWTWRKRPGWVPLANWPNISQSPRNHLGPLSRSLIPTNHLKTWLNTCRISTIPKTIICQLSFTLKSANCAQASSKRWNKWTCSNWNWSMILRRWARSKGGRWLIDCTSLSTFSCNLVRFCTVRLFGSNMFSLLRYLSS